MHSVEAVVVGAGVVGLAIGRELARAGLETFVLEANSRFGAETSSRNSEVIHAGIYYPPGSLKARLCRSGKDRIYDYCRARSVPHRMIGKIIVAKAADEEAELDRILALAQKNGVDDLIDLSAAKMRHLEPELVCSRALLSPSTGIIDSHAFMLSLLADMEAHRGQLVCNTRISRLSYVNGAWAVTIDGQSQPALQAKYLVNSAGLGAHVVAELTEGFATGLLPPLHLARGVYYSYSGRLPFDHLVYPVPERAGLGVHLTIDLAGNARFGPNVEWVDSVDYTLSSDLERDERFDTAARAIWPRLDIERLAPSFVGVRPKLSGPTEPPADFLLLGPAEHRLPNCAALFGIESPGLTASLALASEVAMKLGLAAEREAA